MRMALILIGALVALAAAGVWAYVTSEASDCDTTPGKVGQALDPNIRDQCRMAQTIITASLVAVVAGVGVAAVGVLS